MYKNSLLENSYNLIPISSMGLINKTVKRNTGRAAHTKFLPAYEIEVGLILVAIGNKASFAISHFY